MKASLATLRVALAWDILKTGWILLALDLGNIFFELFSQETLYNIYPFDPTNGAKPIETNWQSWVFLFAMNATILYLISLAAFKEITWEDKIITKGYFCVFTARWIDELLTGSRYWGTPVFSANTVCWGLFAIFLLILLQKWKSQEQSRS